MGLQVAKDGRVVSLTCAHGHAGALVNGGVYWVRRGSISEDITVPLRMSLESEFFPRALDEKLRVFAMECKGVFIDIGVPEDYRRAPVLLL